MITVRIVRDSDQQELARIRISRMTPADIPNQPEGSDYMAEVAVERAGQQQATGIHRVLVLGFPRLRRNVLALVKEVLETMDERDLDLEPGTSASDLARRQYRALPEV